MKRILLLMAAAALVAAAAPRKPRLVVVIVIDQFRYDYLTRFRSEYTGGFDRLLTKGAVFTNANLIHFPTVTAVGHSTVLSGATPSVSGIVGNDWWDREEGKHVTSVSDSKTKLLGGAGEGASPHRLLVSTLGDELKLSNRGKSRVIGISLKDRAAILTSGHDANGAYWFDPNTGDFVSSTYYFAELPGWVGEFNHARVAEKYLGATWLTHTMPAVPKQFYGNSTTSPFETSPFGNDVLEQFVESALQAEQLGKDEFPDVLIVSFSSNDKVGHDYGTYSAEQHDVTVRTDKILARLLQAVDRQVGPENVLTVLTADHGVSLSAAESAAGRLPGGRMPGNTVQKAVEAALVKRYGEGAWVVGSWDLSLYLNWGLIASKGLDAVEVRRVAAEAAFAVPHIFRVYTRDQLMTGSVPGDEISRRVMNGFNVRRSPDIAFIPDPYWLVSGSVTTHGTPFGYDSHVPVIFMGTAIRPGRYDVSIAVNDIAPTLATMLDVEIPSGSVGRVLTEMLAP